jgi:YbgC/YbaW family acyl-CoA thioester hydrolase
MYSSETKFIARYAETDQMGIVHHSNYAVWFEAGRTDFFKRQVFLTAVLNQKVFYFRYMNELSVQKSRKI